MPCDAADSPTPQRSRTGEKDMAIICFRTPQRLVSRPGSSVHEGEIKITMENIAAR
jgi:hypothetical protein